VGLLGEDGQPGQLLVLAGIEELLHGTEKRLLVSRVRAGE